MLVGPGYLRVLDIKGVVTVHERKRRFIGELPTEKTDVPVGRIDGDKRQGEYIEWAQDHTTSLKLKTAGSNHYAGLDEIKHFICHEMGTSSKAKSGSTMMVVSFTSKAKSDRSVSLMRL